MKRNRFAAFLVVTIICLLGLASAATNVRGSSGNGQSADAPNWRLLARNKEVTLTITNKLAYVQREIICLNQTVEAAVPNPDPNLAGTCFDGVYMYLFQVQSKSEDVRLVVSDLLGFSEDSADYGVMICDPENTMELCTNTPATDLPDVIATVTKTSVRFEVPGKFPSYPEGTKHEGAGLTFYVITRQAVPQPVGVPVIRIH
jgi:hypothetical protein